MCSGVSKEKWIADVIRNDGGALLPRNHPGRRQKWEKRSGRGWDPNPPPLAHGAQLTTIRLRRHLQTSALEAITSAHNVAVLLARIPLNPLQNSLSLPASIP